MPPKKTSKRRSTAYKNRKRPGRALERAQETLKGLDPKAQSIARRANARDIVTMARKSAQQALNTLTSIMDDKDADPRARIMAAKEVLCRAYGQAPKHVVHTMVGQLQTTEIEQAALIIMRQNHPEMLIDSSTPLKGKQNDD